ncbi:hypothetical protein [Mycoplasmoides gallisepticum]|uniref:hypothetical protein n=1 Tax=Mycoplasmoides gallisepticum TaxID=2096 RepID=UPI00059EF976|nr:hypothetical protein [Mycoplasmoides gallisepticum]
MIGASALLILQVLIHLTVNPIAKPKKIEPMNPIAVTTLIPAMGKIASGVFAKTQTINAGAIAALPPIELAINAPRAPIINVNATTPIFNK